MAVFVPSPPQQPTQALPLDSAPLAPPIPVDRHVRRGQEEYSHALSALLPQGIAWPRWAESTFMKVVYGLSGGMGWADGRAADLLERESDPRQTVEMLDSWERAWGLPDPCYRGPQSIVERQTALVQRMTLLGAQSREFFINVAAQLGYPVTITEYRPFMTGVDRCGDNRPKLADGTLGDWPTQIGAPTMRFAWTVHVEETKLVWFQAGSGQAGIDPHLRIAKAEDLECVIRRWAPAHTQVLFDYSGMSDPFAGTDQYYVVTRTGEQVVSRTGVQVISYRASGVYWPQAPDSYWVGSPSFAKPPLITSAPPFDVSTQAWLNAVSIRGGTPTDKQKFQTDLLIKGLKADGLWPIIDRLWLWASEPNEPCAVVDIINTGILTNTGAAWMVGRGYTSINHQYINSNFNPVTAAPLANYKQNSASIGVWSNGGPNSTANFVCGSLGNFSTYIDINDGSTGFNYFAINDSKGDQWEFAAGNAFVFGMFAVNRASATNSGAFYNGIEFQFSAHPSTALLSQPLLFCQGNGYVSPFELSIGFIGGSLTNAQHAALYTRLRNYLTGMGYNPGTPPVPPP
jgi:uncharacterized protein YmfQ (DUF2313 family)